MIQKFLVRTKCVECDKEKPSFIRQVTHKKKKVYYDSCCSVKCLLESLRRRPNKDFKFGPWYIGIVERTFKVFK